jgi:dihydrofolate reductase
MGLLTFSLNLTLDGCVDHEEGIADDETHAFFTSLMDGCGAMLWGRVTYEMMENYWPAVARGEVEAPPAVHEWAVKLEVKPKYVASTTRTDFQWTNSHHIAGDLRSGVQKLKDATRAGVLVGSGKLATELDWLNLIDEYKFLIHPRIAGHGPTLYQSGLPSTRRLELVSAKPLSNGAVAMHYRRVRG